MAFSKYANAAVFTPDISLQGWADVSQEKSLSWGSRSAARVVLQEYNPAQFLLSHCTIVASVDTENAPGPLGQQMVDGFQVDRRWADHYITPKTERFVNNNQDSWERKLLLSCFRTFIGGENFVEHIQLPHLSKGKIIDAAARDIGDSVYVDILIATDRKHQALINAVRSGQLQTLSMGCSVEFTQCTKCGNVAADETQLCPHIKYLKGTKFVDASGVERRVAELCGHLSQEPGSVKFIEASWVANPAFKGAVLRSILAPSDLPGIGQKLGVAFAQVPRTFEPGMLPKAARRAEQQFDMTVDQGAPPDKPEAGPLDKAVDEVVNTIRQLAVEKVRGQLEQGKQIPPPETVNRNNNLVKEALQQPYWLNAARMVVSRVKNPAQARRVLLGMILYKRGGWKAVTSANTLTGHDLLTLSYLLESSAKRVSMAGDKRVYRTVLATGGLARYGSTTEYLSVCQKAVGRRLTDSEKQALLDKGHLFSMGVSRNQ